MDYGQVRGLYDGVAWVILDVLWCVREQERLKQKTGPEA
jgi:hypothetical protein